MPTAVEDETKATLLPLSLTITHVAEAVARSSDGGKTLFLSKLGLSDIGANEANELAYHGRRQEKVSVVERFATSINFVSQLLRHV